MSPQKDLKTLMGLKPGDVPTRHSLIKLKLYNTPIRIIGVANYLEHIQPILTNSM